MLPVIGPGSIPLAFNATFTFMISSDEILEVPGERSGFAGDCIFSELLPPRSPSSGTDCA